MKPTQDEIYRVHQALVTAKEAHIRMCREKISGMHPYSRDELRVAADRMTEAHAAFCRTIAPCCGSGPMLTT